ncbi:MAG: 2-amino-4-hydroxy-6-hydroxymethyldihydropteridine diphosphokinase [Robiginitomaculum sp.]
MPIYLGLGANQPAYFKGHLLEPIDTFKWALSELMKQGIRTCAKSSLWESPAWPNPNTQPPYKNAVVRVETSRSPNVLLSTLKKTETEFGRKQAQRNAPRPLDMDILDFNGKISGRANLTFPHPRMCERAFVLLPLQEIAPDWHDPIKNRAISDWIARLHFEDVMLLKRLEA